MLLRTLSCLVFLVGSPLAAQQGGTLADIRQDLAILSVEVQRLKTELSTTGGSSVGVSGSTLDRLVAIESELQRLTGKTEELEFRINRVVQDGTTQIGNLEFRVCELEPGCDISSVGMPAPLGGGQATAVAPTPKPQTGPELAVGEDADLRRAQEALAQGDFRGAADQFAAFRQTYPGSPLEPEALLGQGKALDAEGDIREAARTYLAAYSNYPDSPVAPEALMRLGASLGDLGKIPEACVTLAEVEGRYPDTHPVAEARAAMAALGCQ